MTASTIVRPATLAERVRIELAASFPVWVNVWLGISHVYTALTFFDPGRISAVATLVFPLAWAACFYYARRRQTSLDVLVILSATAPAFAFLAWLPLLLAWDPGNPAGERMAYELLVIAAAVVLAVHCRRTRGWAGVVVFFGAAGLYGLLLESSGITLGYFTEPGYYLYVPWTSTPVAAVAGWCTIYYPSVFIAESLGEAAPAPRRRALVMALLTAVIALCSDLHFDPVATALGFWVWNERLTAAFLGVPLVNFTSWLTAVFGFAVVYFVILGREWSVRVRTLALVLAVPLMQALAGVMNVALIAALEGMDGPSLAILRSWVIGD
ncbi:MAG: carotenoid biosynthesis protein [Gemmatimonadaceae bacterium]